MGLMDEEWYKVLSLTQNEKVFVPNSVGGHVVLVVNPRDILEVTTMSFKVDVKIVLSDWDNRQIPRFR